MKANPGVFANIRNANLKSAIIFLPDHSARNAITGSTRPARRAGNQHAIPAARQSTIAPKNHANMLGVGRPDH